MLFDFMITIRAQLSKWQTQWCQYIFQSKNKLMFLVVSVIHAADHNFQNSSRQRSIITLNPPRPLLLISTPPISHILHNFLHFLYFALLFTTSSHYTSHPRFLFLSKLKGCVIRAPFVLHAALVFPGVRLRRVLNSRRKIMGDITNYANLADGTYFKQRVK